MALKMFFTTDETSKNAILIRKSRFSSLNSFRNRIKSCNFHFWAEITTVSRVSSAAFRNNIRIVAKIAVRMPFKIGDETSAITERF